MCGFLKDFNENYANAVQALTPIVIGIASFVYYEVSRINKENKAKKDDPWMIISSRFWSFGQKYKILAVHKYEKSDDDVSGYKHLSQNSRPDQWRQLIEIKTSFLGFKKEIIPKNPDDILSVVISRDGVEKWKTINFNK